MKRATSNSLLHLLELLDRVEFNVEQNRRRLAEARLLVVKMARQKSVGERTVASARKTSRRKPR